jgi:uncharacterized protein YggE
VTKTSVVRLTSSYAALSSILTLGILLLPFHALAQLAPVTPTGSRDILVSADAWAWSPPDRARISLRLESTAATATEASAALEVKVKGLLETLRKESGAGLEGVDQDLSFGSPGGKDSTLDRNSAIVGVRVIGVDTIELGKVSSIIDAALKSGSATVLDVRYMVQNSNGAKVKAAEEATARAKSKATSVATALGVKLGAIAEVTVVEEAIERTERIERQRGVATSGMSDEESHVLVTLRYQIASS